MISSSTGDLSSTVKSFSNINVRNTKAYSLNNQNIHITFPQYNKKAMELKNVILKDINQSEFEKTVLYKKKDVYDAQNKFKFLEYVDVRRLPMNLHRYKQAVYDVVTTSKVTSHFFLEKLVKHQRHMLVYSKSCGKYLILYFSLPEELRNRSDQVIKLTDVVDKIKMKALDISLPKMLVEIYKNTDINIDHEYFDNEVNDVEEFGYPIECMETDENRNNVNSMKMEILKLNTKIDEIMNDNEKLMKQNQEIKKQNDLIIQLLTGKGNL